MKLSRHMKVAGIVTKIREQLHKIDAGLLAPKSSVSWKAFRKTLSDLEALRSELDNDYHSIISDEQFRELGHIYYGGKTNIKKIMGR